MLVFFADKTDKTAQKLYAPPPMYRCRGIKLKKILTLYNTIPNFDDLERQAFLKHCGKKRKCWLPAFSLFPTMFSTLPKTKFNFIVKLFLHSLNAIVLD